MTIWRTVCYTWGYRLSIRICKAYCFSTATMVTWTHHIVDYAYIAFLVFIFW